MDPDPFSDDDFARLEQFANSRIPILDRVIAVGESVKRPSGLTVVLTSVELWSTLITVNTARTLPQKSMGPRTPPSPAELADALDSLTDDLGHTYGLRSAASGGGTTLDHSSTHFAGPVDPTAKVLTFRPRECRGEVVFHVPLD